MTPREYPLAITAEVMALIETRAASLTPDQRASLGLFLVAAIEKRANEWWAVSSFSSNGKSARQS